MSKEIETQTKSLRTYPKLKKGDDNNYTADVPPDFCLKALMGMRTHEAANGVYQTAISALGKPAEKYADFASAMFAETEPRDAFEAMLIAQMTATHVTFATLSERLSYQTEFEVRESLERSVSRLNRTYIAQLEALKKHRSKAQQTVRVERVTVESGGQAIVGDVSHGGEGHGKK